MLDLVREPKDIWEPVLTLRVAGCFLGALRFGLRDS